MILPILLLSINPLIPVKSIASSKSDLSNLRLVHPDPAENGARSHYSIHKTTFHNGAAVFQLSIANSEHLKLLPIVPNVPQVKILAINPDGYSFTGFEDSTYRKTKLVTGPLYPNSNLEVNRLDIISPKSGEWTVNIQGGTDGEEVILLVEDGIDLHLRACLDSYCNYKYEQVIFNASLSLHEDLKKHSSISTSRALQNGFSLISQEASVQGPDGEIVNTNRTKDQYSFVPSQSGIYIAKVQALIEDSDGHLLHRTTTLPIAVEDAAIEVSTNNVLTESIDNARTQITIELKNHISRDRLIAGAEIWGTGPDGHHARCWIGGITPVSNNTVKLILDNRWLYNCNPEKIEIRSLRLADIDSFVPLSRVNQIKLDTISIPDTKPCDTDFKEMSVGIPSFQKVDPRNHRSLNDGQFAQYGGHNLILVHGYCENGNAWPLDDFNGDFAEYENLYQNFSHDEFANDIWNFGNQFKSYSIVGHSQGGNAALHLFTFYWSGLDWSTDGRKIQTVGAPFGGTPLAGSVADLGDIFGIQCGSNYDMTYDGAALWASYIPSWSRAETWAWSTTFEDGWFYDYCNIGSDLLLWDPEDGVVEVSSAHLDGTNNMGTKEGWCHVEESMADPPQAFDAVRNYEMNNEAAR